MSLRLSTDTASGKHSGNFAAVSSHPVSGGKRQSKPLALFQGVLPLMQDAKLE